MAGVGEDFFTQPHLCIAVIDDIVQLHVERIAEIIYQRTEDGKEKEDCGKAGDKSVAKGHFQFSGFVIIWLSIF
ncbi:hypothetical protein D3C76_1641150 [compost metagenome]